MAETPPDDPTKAPEFQRVLRNMLSTPPKKHAEMKKGGLHGEKPSGSPKTRRD
jgi:hypothetical protein